MGIWPNSAGIIPRQADQCPNFSYFSFFSLLFDPEPYFLRKQPYYPYFLGCYVVKLIKKT